MNRLIWILVGSIALAGLCWFFWGPEVDVPFLNWKKEEIEGPISLPVTRQLTNTEGKTLDVRIIKKSEGKLVVVRESDSKEFSISIDTLSEEDQAFAGHIPETKIEPPFIVAREKDISGLRQKYSDLLEEVASGKLSKMVEERRLEELNQVIDEIDELKKDIEEYRWKNKMD